MSKRQKIRLLALGLLSLGIWLTVYGALDWLDLRHDVPSPLDEDEGVMAAYWYFGVLQGKAGRLLEKRGAAKRKTSSGGVLIALGLVLIFAKPVEG